MPALRIGLGQQIVVSAAVFWFLTCPAGVGLTGIWWEIFGINRLAAAAGLICARLELMKAEFPY